MYLGDSVWVRGKIVEVRRFLAMDKQVDSLFMVEVAGECMYSKVLVREEQLKVDLSEQDAA